MSPRGAQSAETIPNKTEITSSNLSSPLVWTFPKKKIIIKRSLYGPSNPTLNEVHKKKNEEEEEEKYNPLF